MVEHFARVKDYIQQLELKVVAENAKDELIVIDNEQSGIKNLVIDCEYPLLILEQLIFQLPPKAHENPRLMMRLLQMNRELVHGAFVVDGGGKQVLFRDTLQLANLDLNELEASINALSLGLAEFGSEILTLAKQ